MAAENDAAALLLGGSPRFPGSFYPAYGRSGALEAGSILANDIRTVTGGRGRQVAGRGFSGMNQELEALILARDAVEQAESDSPEADRLLKIYSSRLDGFLER